MKPCGVVPARPAARASRSLRSFGRRMVVVDMGDPRDESSSVAQQCYSAEITMRHHAHPRSSRGRVHAVFGDLGISAHASAGSRAMTVAVSIERNKLLMDRVLTER